jgi:hypothetical protein
MDYFSVDWTGLEEFRENLDILERDFPKQAKSLLLKIGSKAGTITKRIARKLVNEKSGKFYKSIKRGKVWKGHDGQFYVRVYTSSKIAPHAFLIENGHRIVDKKGKEHGFKEGVHVFDKATKEMDSQFESILVSEFNKIMDKL